MDIKEAYQEIKYFKELYRDISKLGKAICIKGDIYFIEADGREFFEVHGHIHDISYFSHFMSTHICEIDAEKIKILKGVKKKEVVDVIIDENKITYKLNIDSENLDISFEHDPSLTVDLTVLSDERCWSEVQKVIDIDGSRMNEEILTVFDGPEKILEMPVKPMIIYNPKKDNSLKLSRYTYEDESRRCNIIKLDVPGEFIDLSMTMGTI